MTVTIAAVFLALFSATVPAAAVDRRPPVDQCSADASFQAFRAALEEAIARRDGAFILSIIADDIGVDFGGGVGRQDFIQTWGFDQPATSGLWTELAMAIQLGCMPSPDGEYVSPSIVEQLGDEQDPFTTVLAVRPGAAMRSRPEAMSDAIATLDWDVLSLISETTPEGWLAVALADGRRGYVRGEDVRSPGDYRAYFARRDGRWRMTAFIAGD